MRRPFRWLLGTTAVLMAGAVVWFVVSTLDTERRLEETWKAELFAGLEPLERFPPREINETAMRLEDIATSLGIRLPAQHRSLPEAAAPEDDERFQAMWEALKEWTHAAYAATDGSLPDLPAEVESYLAWAETGLGSLEELMLEAKPPTWGWDVSLRVDMPLPPLLAQLQLHRLLSIRSLQLLREGSLEAADRSLEAAWRLRQATGRDPTLLGQLTAFAQAKHEQLVLRRLCAPEQRWLPRLQETELVPRTLLALQLDAWAISGSVRQGLGLVSEGSTLPVGVFRFSVVAYAEAMQYGIEQLRVQDPRTFDAERFFQEGYERIPRWNFVARILYPDYFDSWLKAVRAELAAELTLMILRQRRGVGLPADSRIESLAVPGAFWSIETVGEETHLKFQDRLPELEGHFQSLEYSLSPADCGDAAGPGQ